MKNFILFLVLLFGTPCFLAAQVVDTAAVRREVDSLLEIGKQQIKENHFDLGLQDIIIGKDKTENIFGKVSELYAKCSFEKGNAYKSIKRYNDAKPHYQESINIIEKIKGKYNIDYINALKELAFIYYKINDYQNAEEYYIELKLLTEDKIGKKSIDYVESIDYLAAICLKISNYKKAEDLYLEASSIKSILFGNDSKDYYVSLSNIALLYQYNREYEKSESLFIEAINGLENTVGNKHRYYEISLENLVKVYVSSGKYREADSTYAVIKKNYQEKYGLQHLKYASLLKNIADLYYEIGMMESSEKYFKESLRIIEKNDRQDSEEYFEIMHNLGVLYNSIDNFQESEYYFEKAKTLCEQIFGKGNSSYSTVLLNLGSLHFSLGNYSKAEEYYLTALSIMETALGKEYPDNSYILQHLAELYLFKKEFNKSEDFYLRTIYLLKISVGVDHVDYALALEGLANLYLFTKQYKKSEDLLLESKNIINNNLGKNNLSYAGAIGNLANFYLETKDYAKSKHLYKECSIIMESIKGKESIGYIKCIMYLNYIKWIEDNELPLTSYEILKNNIISKNTKFLSTEELNKFIYELINNFKWIYSFNNKNIEFCKNLYDDVLFNKEIALHINIILNRNNEFNPEIENLFASQKSHLRRLAAEYSKPIAERDSTLIAEWEEKANTIEKNLVRTVAGYGDLIRQVSWEEVKKRLRPGEAAVELVSYRYYKPEQTDSTMYAALVLLPSDTTPHFIPLFEERQLQALLHRPKLGEELTVKGLYAANSELLNLLWAPLEPLLRDVKTVYYSPAGLLHRINPAALRDASKRYLSEGRQWVRVGSTRELVTGRLADRSYALDTAASATAAVWGGIRYDMDSTTFAAANPLDPAAEPLPEFQRKDGKFRYMVEDSTPALSTGLRGAGDEGWKPLAGSAREAEQVGELLQKAGFRTELLSDYTASEERFKALGQAVPSPRILHVATHGFAYPDPKKEPQRSFAGEEPVYRLQDDPMLRSGLVLAGANHYWETHRPLENREDGVLVAYEVRDLNLRNTELAVLSACQTGLGDVVGSEGVYGLQRAFRIAGAKFLIVSLWQVPDEQTRELMRLFYENWVGKGESLRDAFNHAQATLREMEPNPYMWAGFVLVE